jgi:prepilin-type N-terminal cleavage/methylation domain-containing protein
MIHGQRGFTLTELLVGMAVMALLMAAAFGVLSSSIKAQLYGFSQERGFNDARRVMQTVAGELRYSSGHTISANGVDISYSRPDDATGVTRNGHIQNIAGDKVQITRGTVNEALGSGHVQVNFAQGDETQQIRVTVTAQDPAAGGAAIVLQSVVWTGPVIR